MPFFLAIDAGGTKTDYVLADETRELARTRSGSLKRLRVDADVAAANLDAALRSLVDQSGVPLESITRTCIGAAGNTVPLVANWFHEAFAQRIPGSLLLLADVEIALDAAFPGQAGVLVLAGTGSNIAARSAAGTIATFGGWGPVLADQGSGHAIGLAALRAAFLARDEARPTSLLDAILTRWQLHSIDQLIEHANRTPSPNFAELTHLVLDCAQACDEVATSVLHDQGRQLAYLTRLSLRRLAPECPPIACAGSILEYVPPLRDALIAEVRNEFPNARFHAGVVDPLHGALWRARHPSAPAPA